MKTILTLKYGDKYTSSDVNLIYAKTNGEYNYVCLTDNPSGLHPEINTIPIDSEYGHWNKVLMLGLKNLGDVLYLDLDVHLQQSIVDIWKHCQYTASVAFTYWKSNDFPTKRWESNPDPRMSYLSNYNSSVMLWKSGHCDHIVNKFLENEDYYMVKYCGGDDRFFWHECEMQSLPKGLIYSYVYGADYIYDDRSFKYRPEYMIALLNGQDRHTDVRKKYYDALSLHKMG